MHLDNDHLFDPKKAEKFNKKASDLGNSTAAFNLGVKYRTGQETEIDLEEALKYYRRADELGNRLAKHRIANILKFQIELDNPEIQNAYTDEIIQLYETGHEGNDIIASAKVAKFYINGTGREKDADRAIGIYNEILNKNPSYAEEDTYASVAFIMSLRSFLGINISKDQRQALSFLDKIPEQSNHRYIEYTLKKMKKDLFELINSSSASLKQDKVLQYYECPKKLFTEIKNNTFSISRHALKTIELIKNLSAFENWRDHRDWGNVYEAALASEIKLNFSQLTKSTLNSGPRYNPIDSNGLPILGVWEPPSSNLQDVEHQRLTQGSFVPKSGIINLKGIIADPAHGILFNVEEDKNLPALLIEEDFEVAIILAFLYKKPFYPSLSLETVQEKNIGESGAEQIQYKEFSPEWLGHTDFGRTLFTTDQLIGNWAWRAETFQVGDDNAVFQEGVDKIAAGFIKNVRLTGGRSGDGGSSRVMLKPEKYDMHIYETQVASRHCIKVDITELKMRVDGSYILEKESGEENRLVSLNDTTFEQGRVCQKLTDNYDIIASLDPRFKRGEQLMRLFYAVAHLRENSDYKLPSSQHEHFRKRLEYYTNMGKLPKHDAICRRIPLMR
jgi:TPR repeat protein